MGGGEIAGEESDGGGQKDLDGTGEDECEETERKTERKP